MRARILKEYSMTQILPTVVEILGLSLPAQSDIWGNGGHGLDNDIEKIIIEIS